MSEKSSRVVGRSSGKLGSDPKAVLLIGWTGCRQRDLDKYVDLYLQMGYSVVSIKSPVTDWVTDDAKVAESIVPAIEELERLGFVVPEDDASSTNSDTKNHLIIHSFSNGGLNTLRCFKLALTLQKKRLAKLRLQVVDSAPSNPDWDALRRFAFGFLNVKFFLLKWIITVFFFIVGNLLYLFVKETKLHKVHKMLEDFPDKDTLRLYLFSKGDEIISWKQVQAHISAMKKLGHKVRSKTWETAAHVAIMKLNRDDYKSIILESVSSS